jgi:hypothetical protein
VARQGFTVGILARNRVRIEESVADAWSVLRHTTQWGGEDSNLRPTDYEFDPVRVADQAERVKSYPDQQFRVLITLQRFA